MSEETMNDTFPVITEVHAQGFLSIETDFKSLPDCDFGIQIAPDGRVWICINNQAFIRFKPNRSKK